MGAVHNVLSSMKRLCKRCRLGDVVSASGEFDPTRRTLTVQRLHFVERWQEANPGQHFRPELVLRAQAERKAHNRMQPTLAARSTACSVCVACNA